MKNTGMYGFQLAQLVKFLMIVYQKELSSGVDTIG